MLVSDLSEYTKKLYQKFNIAPLTENDSGFNFKVVFGSSISYVRQKIGIDFTSSDILNVLYNETFESILEFLKTKTSSSKVYNIQLGLFTIGFINSTNENDEKIGNITPMITSIGQSQLKSYDVTDDPMKNSKSFRERNAIAADIMEIDKSVMKKLDEVYGIRLGLAEVIIPVFIICHSMILYELENMLNLSGFDEVSVNVFNLYDIKLIKNNTSHTIIYLPGITMKYLLKNDEVAKTMD